MIQKQMFTGAARRHHPAGLLAIILTIFFGGFGTLKGQTPPSAIGTMPLPSLDGATGWINSPPLSAKALKGKVVVIDFWDYSCINCIRSVPYVRAWAQKYKDSGLVVIGVHTPEFDVEKQEANVRKAVTRFDMSYPIAVDSDRRIWNAFHNQYWPAHYFIDAKGKVRYQHFGEGDYDESERWIRKLLEEANSTKPLPASVSVVAKGEQAVSDIRDVDSPETYLGYERADRFVSDGGIQPDSAKTYMEPHSLSLNEWGLSGQWIDEPQLVRLKSAGGKIVFRFHARDLHLVLGPGQAGKQIHFHVTIDGKQPGSDHGVDTNSHGEGIVTDHRLYQLIRQGGQVIDHTFAIEFDDPGVQAFSFTFG